MTARLVVGFCGFLNLDGSAGCPSALAAMDQAMAAWGDASASWHEGPLALAGRGRESAAVLAEDGLALVGPVRLDDREDLARALDLPASASDAQVLLQAWRRWGPDCTGRLYGDWACAIWDRASQRLWVARDATGNTGLYYWQDGARLVFATSVAAVLAHPAVPRRPNTWAVARGLMVVFDPRCDDEIVYEGIRRLDGGHLLAVEAGRVTLQNWWQPQHLPEFTGADADAALIHARFRELYQRAVDARLGTTERVGLMFSSGLDSGSVAALAAPRLRARQQRLTAWTSAPLFAPSGATALRVGDESALARESAAHIGNIDHMLVDSAQAGVVDSIEHMLAAHGMPIHGVANYYWLEDILQRARAAGVQVMLTGQGGNGSVSYTGSGNGWDELARSGWRGAWENLRHFKHGMLRAVTSQWLSPLIAPPLDTLRRRRWRHGPRWWHSGAIHPAFARDSGLRAYVLAGGDGPAPRRYESRGKDIANMRLGRMASGMLGATWMELGAANGVDARDPTRDRRLIEFCWRVPDAVFWNRGQQRALIRSGMSTLLPASVLKSQRGLQGADFGHRIVAERARVQALLERLQRHPVAAECLDLPRMQAVLDGLAREITPLTSSQAIAVLARGLAFGLFLSRF